MEKIHEMKTENPQEFELAQECGKHEETEVALPPEVWMKVFANLDRRDFPSLLGVNKRFKGTQLNTAHDQYVQIDTLLWHCLSYSKGS